MSNERNRQRQNTRRRPGNSPANPTNAETGPTASSSPPQPPTGSVTRGDDSGSSGGGIGRWVAAAAVAIAVAAGAFSFMGTGSDGIGGGAGDVISQAETEARKAAHETLLAGSGFPVKLVGADEVDDALASMPDTVTEEAREEMREQIRNDGLQLAWVTLWDTHAEDGDILRFESSSSIPIEVLALNAKTTIAIPYPADGKVLVTGVVDGGGGITIALESGATSIAWPTMAVDDQLLLPITPGF